jgi:hypothetical protein
MWSTSWSTHIVFVFFVGLWQSKGSVRKISLTRSHHTTSVRCLNCTFAWWANFTNRSHYACFGSRQRSSPEYRSMDSVQLTYVCYRSKSVSVHLFQQPLQANERTVVTYMVVRSKRAAAGKAPFNVLVGLVQSSAHWEEQMNRVQWPFDN